MEVSSLSLKIQTEGMSEAQRGMEGLTNTSRGLEEETDKLIKRQDAFLQALDRQAATMGKGAAAMRAYKAEQLGLTDDKIFQRLNNQIAAIESKTQGLTNSAGMLEGAFVKIAAAIGLYSIATKAVGFGVDLVKETALLSARYETLGISMVAVGKIAGETSTMMTWHQKALQDTGISAIEARNNLARMAAAQLDLSQSAKLARVAQDAAVLGNINSSEAFERLVQGIVSGQPRILHTMGIFADFGAAESQWAKEHGRTMESLSQAEKVQIRFNATLEEGAKRAGVYEAAMGTAGKQLKSMERYVEDLKVQMGDVFQPALKVLVDDWTKSLKASSDTIVKNRDNINDLGQAMAEVVRQGDGFIEMLAKMGRGQAEGGSNLMTRIVQSTSGAMAFVRDWQRISNGGALGAIQDARAGHSALTDWTVSTFGDKQRSFADWTKVGASDSEGLEGGDPYGAIAMAQKTAKIKAAKEASEAYNKILIPLNQALAMERVTLEEGDRAAYAYALTMKGITEADKAALLVKWDYNKAIKERAALVKWEIDESARATTERIKSSDAMARDNQALQQFVTELDPATASAAKWAEVQNKLWYALDEGIIPSQTEYNRLLKIAEGQFTEAGQAAEAYHKKIQGDVTRMNRAKGGKDELQYLTDLGAAGLDVDLLRQHMEKFRIEQLRLRAEAGDTWAIIGYTVTQNAGRATDAMVSWMDNLDGVGRSWRTLGDTVRNVIADMLRQMERAIIQQKLMQPLMNWGMNALFGAPATAGTSAAAGAGATGSGVGSMFAGMSSFAVGTDYVPQDMVAMIHQGERIVPASQNRPGAGSQVNHISIAVKVESNGQVSSEASSAAGVDLARRIARGEIHQWAMEQSRSNGLLAAGA